MYPTGVAYVALSRTGRYPFYIQQFGKHAWNVASATPITTVDLEAAMPAAMPAAQQALDSSIYEVRIQRATDQERRDMRAMAELGAGPSDVAAQLRRKTSEVSVVCQRLLEKGLVYATEDYGCVDFIVPRFGECMARQMPFRAPRRRAPSN